MHSFAATQDKPGYISVAGNITRTSSGTRAFHNTASGAGVYLNNAGRVLTSDRSLKTDIRQLAVPILIAQPRGFFLWATHATPTVPASAIRLVAQEVEEVFPIRSLALWCRSPTESVGLAFTGLIAPCLRLADADARIAALSHCERITMPNSARTHKPSLPGSTLLARESGDRDGGLSGAR